MMTVSAEVRVEDEQHEKSEAEGADLHLDDQIPAVVIACMRSFQALVGCGGEALKPRRVYSVKDFSASQKVLE